MNPQASPSFISVADYLQGELHSEIRHEYVGGRIYAMVGASDRHNLINLALASRLYQTLRGSGCQVFTSDMKVHLSIAGDDIFYYPDIMVSCREDDRATYYREHPVLIVEVLSESTERLDRREKFLAYRQLPSLQEYVLLSQDRIEATVFRRAQGWQPEILREGDALKLTPVEFVIAMTEVYEAVR